MTNNKKEMAKKVIRGALFFFGLPLLMFLLAGTLRWWQAWVYLGISYGASIISRVLIARIHPDLVQERGSYDEKKDVKPWDKWLMPLVALAMPTAYYLTAGLDKRFSWSGPVPLWLYQAALILTLAAFCFSSWALVANRFFSAVVRIQTDRGHKVVEKGPYVIVRHPGYAAGIVVALMFPIMLGSWWAYVPVGIMTVFTVLRTALEDKTLINELPGYAGYTQKTRYRLLPGIW